MKIVMNIQYRTGQKADCPKIAKFINIASGGVIAYLFNGLVPDQAPTEIIAHNLERGQDPYSYQNAIVAECKQEIVGIALSFPSDYHHITDEMRQFFPKERLSHLQDFYSARVENSLLLNALCVDEAYRRKGIGDRLIALTKAKARQSGYNWLSLIVFADNEIARRVYQKSGFETVENVTLNPREHIPHEGGCLLMKCHVNEA